MNAPHAEICEWAKTYFETFYGPRQSWTEKQWNDVHSAIGLIVVWESRK